MTSNCLNCKQEILFGNMTGDDFCRPDCYNAYLLKYPDFPKRGEPGRCMHCGSPHIEILKKDKTINLAGNIQIAGDMAPRYVTTEFWKCHNCEKDGKDIRIGAIVTDPEDLEAYKETTALTTDQNENPNRAEPGRNAENHLGVP